MTNEAIQKRIAELREQDRKLLKVKSASPMEIIERRRKVTTEIARLEQRLRGR